MELPRRGCIHSPVLLRSAAGMGVRRALRQRVGSGHDSSLPRRSSISTLGLPEQKDAWYRYTWDRSLFLVYRRKELRNIMAELDFNQQVANAFIPYPEALRVTCQPAHPASVPLRISTAWRWWVVGSPSRPSRWRSIRRLRRA